EAPRQQQWTEVSRGRDAEAPDTPSAGGEDLSLVDEVAGEEDDEEHFRQLAGLEVDGPETNPETGAVDLPSEPRAERHQKREQPEEEEGVPVAFKAVYAPNDDKRPDERGDAHHRPHGLTGRELVVRVSIDAGDDDEADPVEECSKREQRPVGARCESAHGD